MSEQLAKLLKCKYCGYHPKELGKLTRHMKEVHTSIRKFHCNNCDYSAKRKENLRKHISSCKKGRPEDLPKGLQKKSKPIAAKKVTCETCLETFAREQELMAHTIKSGHVYQSWPKCELCKHVFVNTVGLERHQRFSCTEKCKVCSKRLLGTNLASHMRHHQHKDGAKKKVNESAILFQIKHALQWKQRPMPVSNNSTSDKVTACEGRETSNNHVISNFSQIGQTGDVFTDTAKSTCLNVEGEEENEIGAEFFSADFGGRSCFEAARSNEERSLENGSHNTNNSEEEVVIPYFCTWCSIEGDKGFTTEEMEVHLKQHHDLTLSEYCELNSINFCI